MADPENDTPKKQSPQGDAADGEFILEGDDADMGLEELSFEDDELSGFETSSEASIDDLLSAPLEPAPAAESPSPAPEPLLDDDELVADDDPLDVVFDDELPPLELEPEPEPEPAPTYVPEPVAPEPEPEPEPEEFVPELEDLPPSPEPDDLESMELQDAPIDVVPRSAATPGGSSILDSGMSGGMDFPEKPEPPADVEPLPPAADLPGLDTEEADPEPDGELVENRPAAGNRRRRPRARPRPKSSDDDDMVVFDDEEDFEPTLPPEPDFEDEPIPAPDPEPEPLPELGDELPEIDEELPEIDDEISPEPVPDPVAEPEPELEELPDVPDLPPEPEPLPELEPELPPESEIEDIPEPIEEPEPEVEIDVPDVDEQDESEEPRDLVAAIDDAFEDLPDMPAFEASKEAPIDPSPKPDLEAIAKQAITNLPRSTPSALPDSVPPVSTPEPAGLVDLDDDLPPLPDLDDDLPLPDSEDLAEADLDGTPELADDFDFEDAPEDEFESDDDHDADAPQTGSGVPEPPDGEFTKDADDSDSQSEKPSATATIFGGLRNFFGQLKTLELVCLVVIFVACVSGIFLFQYWEKLGTPPREIATQPADKMPANLDGEVVKTSSLRAYWRNPTEKEAEKMREFQLIRPGPKPPAEFTKEDIEKEVAKAAAQKKQRIAGQFIPEIELTLSGGGSGNVVISFYNPDGELIDTADARIESGKFVSGGQSSATTTFACTGDGFATEFVLTEYQKERESFWYVKIRESKDNKEFTDIAFFNFPGDSQ